MEIFTKVPNQEEFLRETAEIFLYSDHLMYYREDQKVEAAKELAEEDWLNKWTPDGKYAKYYYDKVIIRDNLFAEEVK